MDAINSLAGGARNAQVAVDAAAQKIAAADLPTAAHPDPTNPAPTNSNGPAPATSGDVDVADQLVTMTVAADMHHVTTAAMRSAFSMYRDSLDLLP
jgi:hypothetical protein